MPSQNKPTIQSVGAELDKALSKLSQCQVFIQEMAEVSDKMITIHSDQDNLASGLYNWEYIRNWAYSLERMAKE